MANNFDPDAYLAATAPKSKGFNPDEYLAATDPSYLQKTSSNILPDIASMLIGLGSTVKEGAFDMPMRALQTGTQMAAGVPYAETPSGQKDVQFVQNAPEMASEIVKPFVHPIDYMQEHPVQQALNILGVGQLATRGAGAALNATKLTENLVPTVERIANNQTLKGFGGSMAQIKQMAESGGRPALDAAAKYARENGISDVFSTNMGRDNSLNALLRKTGEKVGAFRKEAGPAPADIINQALDNPKANLDQYLGEGLASGQLPKVDQAIADIQRISGKNPTHAKIAEAATYINKQAAGNKLYQPVTAETDLANALSDVNNQGIAQSLGPDKALQYVKALDDQKKLYPLEHLQARGELRDTSGRGMGIGGIVQKIADDFGYRLTAKTAAAIHEALVSNNIPITRAAVANQLATIGGQQPSVSDLIQKLKEKFDQRRAF